MATAGFEPTPPKRPVPRTARPHVDKIRFLCSLNRVFRNERWFAPFPQPTTQGRPFNRRKDGLNFCYKLEIELNRVIRSNSTVDDLTDSWTNQKGSKRKATIDVKVQLVSMQIARRLYDNRSGRTRKRWQRVRTLLYKINQCSNGKLGRSGNAGPWGVLFITK